MTSGSASVGHVWASTFDELCALRWARHMGHLADLARDVELFGLDVDDTGRIRMHKPHVTVPVCVYVAVDDRFACLYIGQCRRLAGSVTDRVAHHHAIPPSATGLWVLPVRRDCPKWALGDLETRMISAFRPPYNRQHCPSHWQVRARNSSVTAVTSGPVSASSSFKAGR